MTELQAKALNKLLDQCEKGKDFSCVKISPKRIYRDWDSRYFDIEKRKALLEEMRLLEKQGLVTVNVDPWTGYIKSISIVPDKISDSFRLLHRKQAVIKEEEDSSFVRSLSSSSNMGGRYIEQLADQVNSGDMIDHTRCTQFLAFLDYVSGNNTEMFEKELSQKIFGDTKAIEKKYRNALTDLLCSVDSACESIRLSTDNKDDANIKIMESYGILRAPSFSYIKGNGIIRLLDGREIAIFSDFPTAITSDMLPIIQKITLENNCVITVENLTAFTRVRLSEAAVVYLGGYHNRVKQRLLTKIRQDNPQIASWLHSGDLDPDGIQILLNLCDKTGISFEPFLMDPDLIDAYIDYTKPMEDPDIKLASKLKENGVLSLLVDKLLTTGRKLEQEIIFYDNYKS